MRFLDRWLDQHPHAETVASGVYAVATRTDGPID
jgi:hypothetical protein